MILIVLRRVFCVYKAASILSVFPFLSLSPTVRVFFSITGTSESQVPFCDCVITLVSRSPLRVLLLALVHFELMPL